MKKSTVIASLLTISLIIFGAVLVYIRRGDLSDLGLNEIGDFLAGFAAPLAFIWLIAGYVQQGRELEQNTEALKSQQKELKEQVEATKALALQADRQAKASEDAAKFARKEASKNAKRRAILRQPDFTVAKWSTENGNYRFVLVNHRSEVFNIRVHHGNFKVGDVKQLGRDQKYEFALQGPFHQLIKLKVEYTDIEGHPGYMKFCGEPDSLNRFEHWYKDMD